MSLGGLVEVYQFVWSLESHAEQRLAWADAADARIARARAEARSLAQHRAMMEANPSGALGGATLNDVSRLLQSGLLK